MCEIAAENIEVPVSCAVSGAWQLRSELLDPSQSVLRWLTMRIAATDCARVAMF